MITFVKHGSLIYTTRDRFLESNTMVKSQCALFYVRGNSFVGICSSLHDVRVFYYLPWTYYGRQNDDYGDDDDHGYELDHDVDHDKDGDDDHDHQHHHYHHRDTYIFTYFFHILIFKWCYCATFFSINDNQSPLMTLLHVGLLFTQWIYT